MPHRIDEQPRRSENAEPASAAGVDSLHAQRIDSDEGRELLAGIRRGDGKAFEALAREVSPRLYRTALHLTGRPDEAEDLVQETLVRALPALRRFEGRAQLSTYLIRALGNVWKNRLRSRSRSRIVQWLSGRSDRWDAEDRPPLDPPDPARSPLATLEADEAAAVVRNAVLRLSPDRRMTLVLREVEELPYEEIAAVMEIPVGTVRSRLARAREDLRRILGGRP